ncbi:4-hydroxy-2-oxoheptanedioate aldolase [Thiolinea disciformis]|uniref:4-hydroxy-2-oxoheptanedioate aldolase n=1 Tax=Thiolinea disciformis TaxID=125614 RepID=UPI00037EFBC0|nr:4-hydroxy-2-oxoheptanedioate aldolase [Thiolinea disciformis]
MQVPKNHFKQALQAQQVQYGLWVGLVDPICAEIAASSGFDWILLDGEHAPNDMRTILHQLQATAAYPTQVLARPVEGTPSIIKQWLDIGVQSLLIPMVETSEQAAMLAAACHYPPRGIRGVGTALARAANWGRIPNYLQTADHEICLLIQVENRKGLDNLDAILQVDGIDGVFIGPADLAASFGHLGQPNHPEVSAAIEQALHKIRQAGKAAGILSVDPKLARHYQAQGANFIAVGVDTLLLARSAVALAAEFKQDITEAPNKY